jgi:protein-S-isoprenylcysteine O-methyltransferase Ste14
MNNVARLPEDMEERLQSSGWWANLLVGALVALGAAGVGAYMIASADSRQNVIAGVCLLAAGLLVLGWLTYWMAPILWRMAHGREIDPRGP